jgi:hypothetical protein
MVDSVAQCPKRRDSGIASVVVRPKNMTADQLQVGYKRFTKDCYRIMEMVCRAFKQPNALAKITGLISKVTLRLNCMLGNKRFIEADGTARCAPDTPDLRAE